jgi:NhaA family Na+:H+ antiporter
VAGVLLGLLTPARQAVGKQQLLAVVEAVGHRLRIDPDSDDMSGFADETQALVEYGQSTLSPLDRLQMALHPWVAFVIMPLFALANAGVSIDLRLIGNPVALAVALGLLIGKPIGIVLFSLAAVRLGIARLPSGVTTRVLVGAGCLGGIGFTMSLFIAALALQGDLLMAGKIGTLMGSLASAVLGSVLLRRFLPRVVGERGRQPTELRPSGG